MSQPPDWYTDGAAHLWLPYTQMQTAPKPLPVTGTDGVRIKLADGREIVDGIASWWTACHGYNHPHIARAMTDQLAAMPHVMLGGMVHEPAARLAKRLADLLPGDLNHVFFSDSGSVSVEIAMKMARQFWLNQDVEGRTGFLSFRSGYHGDTAATMAVGDPDNGMQGPLGPALAHEMVVDFPRGEAELEVFDKVLAEHAHKLAAITFEPLIQGAGGMKFHEPEQLRTMAEVARAHDVLLIADEIFTGFGRTGSMFACEQADLVPDIICLGKALSGGAVAMAATVANDRVYDAFLSDDPSKALMHGPTFMGNPVACAAANASLDLFETEPRLEQVRRIESHMTQSLEQFRGMPGVRDVRVKGAVGVVEMEKISDPAAMRHRFQEEGVWIRPIGNTIYLTPSFTIGGDDLARLTQAIGTVIEETRD